ncbi:MAG: MBL fold metallo-hydrolase [Lachnospiraceae bacterium]|nr:MBL fold metallo-hydrolase [Lachnospiraceae bacterium]
MLELHFINVGDGDAILIREESGGRSFDMLVDAGRPEILPEEGSLRRSAAEYLAILGVTHLDLLVGTHLHIDHFGGVARLLSRIHVDQVISGYFPLVKETRICRTSDQKSVRGLIDCLNGWAEITEKMRESSFSLVPVSQTVHLEPTPRLMLDILCPDPDEMGRQTERWNALFAGKDLSEEELYRSSKLRNPLSLRVRLHYAGREIELSGDCLGAGWEESGKRPCDLWKVPHHGDIKSVTPELAETLHPRYAVISCEKGYNAKKDRPSAWVIDLLRKNGAEVWFTDTYEAPWYTSGCHRAAVFIVEDDGTILSPGGDRKYSPGGEKMIFPEGKKGFENYDNDGNV